MKKTDGLKVFALYTMFPTKIGQKLDILYKIYLTNYHSTNSSLNELVIRLKWQLDEMVF